MAHPCGDPNRATQRRAESVASNSRRIRGVAPNRATPPNQGVAPFSGPRPSHFPVSFAAARGSGRGGVCRGGLVEVSRRFWVPERIALQGGVAATVTQVALLCATKYS